MLFSFPIGQDEDSLSARIQRFKHADGDGNKILSLAEVDGALREKWKIPLPKPVIDRAFHAARDLSPPDSFAERRAQTQGYNQADYIDCGGEWRVFFVYLRHYLDLYKVFMEIGGADRRISQQEFMNAIPQFQALGAKGLTAETAHQAYGKLDADGGGMVLFDEFADWMLRNADFPDMWEDKQEQAEALELLRRRDANLTSRDLEELGGKHAQLNVAEGVQGQGCLVGNREAAVGKCLLGVALGVKSGTLKIDVVNAKGLRIADRRASDPYCVVKWGSGRDSTRTIAQNLNPIWNECIRFDCDDGDEVKFKLFDYDMMSKDDFLGEVRIKTDNIRAAKGPGGYPAVTKPGLQANGHRQTLRLTGPQAQGTIEVIVSWSPNA